MEEIATLVLRARDRRMERAERHRAFGQLVLLCQAQIYAFAYAVLKDAQSAQEVTQETLICAYQHLDQVREPTAFPAWVRQLARTQCNRLQRKKQLPLSTLAGEEAALDGDPAEQCAQAEVHAQVIAAIQQLPEHEQVVVELFYLHELSLAEIAERLTLPITTIKKRLQYARTRLRTTLQAMADVAALLFVAWPSFSYPRPKGMLLQPVPILVARRPVRPSQYD